MNLWVLRNWVGKDWSILQQWMEGLPLIQGVGVVLNLCAEPERVQFLGWDWESSVYLFLNSYNLWTFIPSLKNENYTTFLLRWICELHELWKVKCSVWVFWWLLLFFLMLLTKQVITESIHFTLTSSQKWTAAIVPLLSDWNVSRNLQAGVVRSHLVEVPQLYTYLLLFESNLTRDKCVVSQSLIKIGSYKCKICFACWNWFHKSDIQINCFDTENGDKKALRF